MSAATQDVCRPKWSLPEFPPNEAHTQLTNTVIWQGSVAMLASGKAKPYAAGASTFMLGVALRNYTAGGADVVYPDGQQMIFQRGVFPFAAVSGSEPTEALINQPVFFADNQTVQATNGGNMLSGILRAITEGSYFVEIS